MDMIKEAGRPPERPTQLLNRSLGRKQSSNLPQLSEVQAVKTLYGEDLL